MIHDVLHMISDDSMNTSGSNTHKTMPTISSDFPAMCRIGSPNMEGVTYLTIDTITYMAMNECGFELYVLYKNYYCY